MRTSIRKTASLRPKHPPKMPQRHTGESKVKATSQTRSQNTSMPVSSVKNAAGQARPQDTSVTGSATKKAAELAKDTSNWLTRNASSDVLRCSLQTLKNYEARGYLNPLFAVRKDSTGHERMMLVYDPDELSKLPSKKPGGPSELMREPGERAARVFELLRQGYQLDDIVIELRETPDRIDELNRQWLDQSKGRHVINPEAQRELEKILGSSFKDIAELIELVERRIKASSEKTE